MNDWNIESENSWPAWHMGPPRIPRERKVDWYAAAGLVLVAASGGGMVWLVIAVVRHFSR